MAKMVSGIHKKSELKQQHAVVEKIVYIDKIVEVPTIQTVEVEKIVYIEKPAEIQYIDKIVEKTVIEPLNQQLIDRLYNMTGICGILLLTLVLKFTGVI
jgi:hypothetical protein